MLLRYTFALTNHNKLMLNLMVKVRRILGSFIALVILCSCIALCVVQELYLSSTVKKRNNHHHVETG